MSRTLTSFEFKCLGLRPEFTYIFEGGQTLSGFFEAPVAPPGNEIDFYAIFQFLWAQRLLISIVATVVSTCALGYAYFSTPVYQVNSILRPAAVNELDALNRSEVYSLPPSAALAKVAASLGSYEVRLSFFRENQGLFQKYIDPVRSPEKNFEVFNKNSMKLSFSDAAKDNGDFNRFVGLSFDYISGVDGALILNKFIDYVVDIERRQVSADMEVLIKNRLAEIKGKIESARSNYQIEKDAKIASLLEADSLRRAQLEDELNALRMQLKIMRGDRVAQLNEAITIARSLGIKKPATPSSLALESLSGTANVIKTEINNQQVPLYFLGVDALEAELGTLQKRTSDDFVATRISEIAKELQLLKVNREVEVLRKRSSEDLFLSNIQSLRSEAARLSSINTDFSRVQLVSIDQRALPADSPIKPKRLLIVLLGVIAGLMLGVLLAFMRYLAKVMYERSSVNALHHDVRSSSIIPRGETARIE